MKKLLLVSVLFCCFACHSGPRTVTVDGQYAGDGMNADYATIQNVPIDVAESDEFVWAYLKKGENDQQLLEYCDVTDTSRTNAERYRIKRISN